MSQRLNGAINCDLTPATKFQRLQRIYVQIILSFSVFVLALGRATLHLCVKSMVYFFNFGFWIADQAICHRYCCFISISLMDIERPVICWRLIRGSFDQRYAIKILNLIQQNKRPAFFSRRSFGTALSNVSRLEENYYDLSNQKVIVFSALNCELYLQQWLVSFC